MPRCLLRPSSLQSLDAYDSEPRNPPASGF
mgnify:CR=1 FL=1